MKAHFAPLLVFVLLASSLFAQNDCTTPDVISSLPYIAEGLSTTGTLDDYGPDDACLSASMENEDYVFSYTPASAQVVNIALSDTEIITDAPVLIGATIGLFVMDGVPTDPATTCVAVQDGESTNPEILNLSLNAGTTYYIIVSSSDIDYIIDTYASNVNFSISVNEVYADDAGITMVQPIASDCQLSTVSVTCTIENFGLNEITSLDLTYSVDGTPHTETYTGSILYGNTAEFTFTTPADVSVEGSHEIEVSTNLPGDMDASNDSYTMTVTNLPLISTIPYMESFETDDHYWTGSEGGSWAHAVPNDTNVINTAVDGTQVLGTNPDGNANTNETSNVTSPCFDFSSSNGVEVSFALWHELGMIGASLSLQYSVDGGSTWILVDDSYAGSSEGWMDMAYELPELAGETSCRFRFAFASGFLPIEGVAIDMFAIEELPAVELSVDEILSPVSSCLLGASETVEIAIANNGVVDQTGFSLSYSVDGGVSWETETYGDILSIGEETVYSFITPADLSTIGSYELICAIYMAGDENTDNDTMSMMVNHGDILSDFPYAESFESGNAGWTAGGENSSLELATPAASLINAASDGSMAWVTNASGYHNNAEYTYLVSPCFDFSALSNPTLDVDLFYNVQNFTAGMVLEYSLDNGMTWDTLQASAASVNWYGGDLIAGTSWSGNSESWVSVHNTMPELAGEANVQLRFVFDAGNFSMGDYEGVAIDHIRLMDCTDVPTADFDFTMNSESEVAFTDLSTNADSVEWNFGDNDFFPSTSNEADPVFTYAAEGSYTVTLTVFNACGVDVASETIDIVFTGINALQAESVDLYPNPAKDMLTIQANELSGVKVFSLDGRLLIDAKATSDTYRLNVETLDAGMYLIVIDQNNVQISRRFVKQ